MLKKIIILTAFLLLWPVLAMGKQMDKSYNDIINQFKVVEELSLQGRSELFLKEFNKFLKIPSKNAEKVIRDKILDSLDNQGQLGEAIFLAGLLELKGLRKIIERIHTTDLLTNLNIYFYFYKIGYKKESQFKSLTYFSDVFRKSQFAPYPIAVGGYHAFYLMGWIFDQEILNYLQSYNTEKFDGGLAETFYYSLERVKLVLKTNKLGRP